MLMFCMVPVYGFSEPWIDPATGTIRLDSVTRPCAPGTAVPADFTGGFTNPCTQVVALNQCGGAPGM